MERYALRRKFTELTGMTVQTGGTTIGTEEGRMVRIAMKELGYKREAECVDHGWNVRYGKDDVWYDWKPITFEENSIDAEYRVALARLTRD